MYIIIGSRLNLMRKRYLLSTTEASKLFGIPIELYVQYELGRTIPLDKLFRIAQWYGCEISELLPTFKECEIFWNFKTGESLHNGIRYTKKDGEVKVQIGSGVPISAPRTLSSYNLSNTIDKEDDWK